MFIDLPYAFGIILFSPAFHIQDMLISFLHPLKISISVKYTIFSELQVQTKYHYRMHRILTLITIQESLKLSVSKTTAMDEQKTQLSQEIAHCSIYISLSINQFPSIYQLYLYLPDGKLLLYMSSLLNSSNQNSCAPVRAAISVYSHEYVF